MSQEHVVVSAVVAAATHLQQLLIQMEDAALTVAGVAVVVAVEHLRQQNLGACFCMTLLATTTSTRAVPAATMTAA